MDVVILVFLQELLKDIILSNLSSSLNIYFFRTPSPRPQQPPPPQQQPDNEEPLSSQLRKSLTTFQDNNRTPSPAVKDTENLLTKARNARKQRDSES